MPSRDNYGVVKGVAAAALAAGAGMHACHPPTLSQHCCRPICAATCSSACRAGIPAGRSPQHASAPKLAAHLSGRSSPGCNPGKGSGYGWILLTGAAAASCAAAARASRLRRRSGRAAASGAAPGAAARAALAGQRAAIGAVEATAMLCGSLTGAERWGRAYKAPRATQRWSVKQGTPVPRLAAALDSSNHDLHRKVPQGANRQWAWEACSARSRLACPAAGGPRGPAAPRPASLAVL